MLITMRNSRRIRDAVESADFARSGGTTHRINLSRRPCGRNESYGQGGRRHARRKGERDGKSTSADPSNQPSEYAATKV